MQPLLILALIGLASCEMPPAPDRAQTMCDGYGNRAFWATTPEGETRTVAIFNEETCMARDLRPEKAR